MQATITAPTGETIIAPDTRGEAADKPRAIEARTFEHGRGRNVLPIIAHVRGRNRETVRMRSVMQAARQREAARRAAIREAAAIEATPFLSPFMQVQVDAALGRLPFFYGTATETLYLRDDSGKVRGTATIEAPGYMVWLERLAGDYKSAQRVTEACMRSEPHNSGRAALAQRAPNSVNGTEVRGGERWQGSRRDSITVKRTASDGSVYRVAPDWQCYRVTADGSRVPLVSSATAAKRKSSAGTLGSAATLARVVAD